MNVVALILSVIVAGFVEFDKTVCDMGVVSVKDGPQTCEFNVVNRGEDALYIVAVSKSCSCTSVEWTRTPIRSGESGKVVVTYSPEEGPHPFDKALSVYFDSIDRPVTLHVRGSVTNKKVK